MTPEVLPISSRTNARIAYFRQQPDASYADGRERAFGRIRIRRARLQPKPQNGLNDLPLRRNIDVEEAAGCQ